MKTAKEIIARINEKEMEEKKRTAQMQLVEKATQEMFDKCMTSKIITDIIFYELDIQVKKSLEDAGFVADTTGSDKLLIRIPK